MSTKSPSRTTLGKVRGLGSSGGGTTAFWHERVSAVALLPLTLVTIGVVLSVQGARYADVVALLSHPLIAIALIAMVATSAWHMKLGMTVIIEDYVHSPAPHLVARIANTLFSSLIGLTGVFALLKIAFGG